MYKHLIEYKYIQGEGRTQVTVNSYAINHIILERLRVGDEFTVRDVIDHWDHRHAYGRYAPDSKYIEQSLDELLGTLLTKSICSVKLKDGSRTEWTYKRIYHE